MSEPTFNHIDHTRGFCGKPNVPLDTSRATVEKNGAKCLCCDSDMEIMDCSASMDQLGCYALICQICPDRCLFQ